MFIAALFIIPKVSNSPNAYYQNEFIQHNATSSSMNETTSCHNTEELYRHIFELRNPSTKDIYYSIYLKLKYSHKKPTMSKNGCSWNSAIVIVRKHALDYCNSADKVHFLVSSTPHFSTAFNIYPYILYIHTCYILQ
jgi:hypothetical protein